jgi:hypothetical protein
MGVAEDVLRSGPSAVIDRANAISVRLGNPDRWLEGCDDDALIAGANLALVGDELLQFGEAVPLGNGHFRLSRLLRGRFGTEWAIGDHRLGERFIRLAPGTFTTVNVPAACIGGSATVIGRGVGDLATPGSAIAGVTGEAMRPLAPGRLWMEQTAKGLLVRWSERAIEQLHWLDGQAMTPAHSYRVRVDGEGGSHEQVVTGDRLMLTDEMLATIGGAKTVSVHTHGPVLPSHEITITVSQEPR